MKKEYKLIIFIIILTIGLLLLRVPFEHVLNSFSKTPAKNELITKIFTRLFLFVILILIVRKLGLNSFNGITREIKIRDKNVLIVPILLIMVGLWGSWTTITDAETELLLLFTVSVLLIGLVEETCMRGLVLPLLINSQNRWKYSLYFGVIVSALIFGFIHYLNLFKQPENFWGITSQVFFGTSIGIVFGALMIRTGNLFVVALCHAFVNFIFSNRILKGESANQIIRHSSNDGSLELVSLIGTVAFFCIIAGIGLNMIRKVDKTEIETELRSLDI